MLLVLKSCSMMSVKVLFRQCSRILRHHRYADCFHLKNSRALSIWSTSGSKDWKRAVSEAEKIVGYPTSFMSLRCLLSDELANVAVQVRKLIGTNHPLLKTARGFLDNGKHSLQTRGLIVLLIAKAAGTREDSFDEHEMVSGIYPNQRKLAEITEMIHTAQLVHRGVVNLDTLQPSDSSYRDMEFGNKIAVLSGDFLLANASTGLADLNNTKVVEMISQAIGHLMEAEFTSLRDHNGQPRLPDTCTFSEWEKQTYLQSGSLLSKSCRSALELAGHEESLQQCAAMFGENIALARQMSEDLQPFLNAKVDSNGLISSGPVIRHVELYGTEALQPNMDNRQILKLVSSRDVLNWCIDRCQQYGEAATSALNLLQSSDAKQALRNIVKATTNLQIAKS